MTHLRHGRPRRIRGWGLVRARGARLAQRRYMRLMHYTLTIFDAADENADLVLFEEILVGATVSSTKRRREIVVKFAADRLLVQLRTDTEFEAWVLAFKDAARVASDFYKLVPSRQLGSGAFSTVYFGFDREDGHHVAIKVVDKTKCSRAELTYAETEARMMAYVRHPSIVQCRDIFDAPPAMHVVMEYMSGSTLEHRMNTHRSRFSEPVTATIMSHVLDALAYLESEGVCHRDVKPDNILLSTTANDAMWPTTARLSDFGLAAFVDSDTDLSDIVGTPNYVAPEVITRDATDNERVGYGPPVDAWAAGILMHWMLTGGHLPFDGADSAAIFRAIRACNLQLDSPRWHNVSTDAKSLLRSLLHPCAHTRLTCSAARSHPWLRAAHAVLPAARLSAVYAQRTSRRAALTPSARLRALALAVRAVGRLRRLVDGGAAARARELRLQRVGAARGAKKTSLEEKMARAPEIAPAGADALGYNVGLIPSFAPKRRARAGVADGTIGAEVGEGGRSRLSRESGSSGGQSRGGSADRGGSLERGVGSKKGSNWGIKMRVKERGSLEQ